MELIIFDLFIVVVIGGVGKMAIAEYYNFFEDSLMVYGSLGTDCEGDLKVFP